MFLAEACEEARVQGEASRQRRCWGPWRLDVEHLALDHQQVDYWIDLTQMNTSAEMLDWIFQIQAKGCFSAEDVGKLVHALEDIFDPQSCLCSLGPLAADRCEGTAPAEIPGRHLPTRRTSVTEVNAEPECA